MEEKKKNNAATLEQVKKEYQKPCMTQEQVEQMKQRIEEARAEKQKKAANSYMGRKIAAAAAVVVAAFIVLPNTSENVAHAMNQIPVLGGLVEAVTFRDYKYDNGKHTADIETPKLSVKKSKTDQEDSKTQQNLKEIGIIKGKRGTPGELTGIINYSSRYCLGDVKKNTKAGVYGKLDGIPEELTSEQQIPVGFKQEVQLGKAEIICTLEGERKSYDIEITQTNFNARETNKGIRFVVKDQELCALTGGIVQGMSGSPIVQNGKIIGAVTHVFVQDASKGYGIFIEEMLEQG